jgi:hypothetical protein
VQLLQLRSCFERWSWLFEWTGHKYLLKNDKPPTGDVWQRHINDLAHMVDIAEGIKGLYDDPIVDVADLGAENQVPFLGVGDREHEELLFLPTQGGIMQPYLVDEWRKTLAEEHAHRRSVIMYAIPVAMASMERMATEFLQATEDIDLLSDSYC